MAHELNIAKGSPALRRNVSLDTDEIWQARTDLAACLRMAARLGLEEGICNHFSAIVPGHPDLFIVNRLGWAFQEASAGSNRILYPCAAAQDGASRGMVGHHFESVQGGQGLRVPFDWVSHDDQD